MARKHTGCTVKVDPRLIIINERLKEIRRVIAVSGGKGGVGKSLVASTLALLLARRGFKVGLFDADFTSPSTHAILGVKKLQATEDRGIIPATVHDLRFMSIVAYSGNSALPLRGADVSNALIELLAVTRWGALDFLIIDMPPGINDATLDMLRFLGKIEFLIVTTPSILAFETVTKLVSLLSDLRIPIIGIIENMKIKDNPAIKQLSERIRVNFLGAIPFDENVEDALGDVERLLGSLFAKKLDEALSGSDLYKP